MPRDALDLDDIRAVLRNLPEVRDAAPAGDTFGAVAEVAKTLRKLGLQQTRTGTDLLGGIRDLSSRFDEVHQAALDARDRAVEAERQAEKLAGVLIAHLDVIERAVSVMREAGGLDAWVEQLENGVTRALQDATKWGLSATGTAAELFDPEVHDPSNEIPPTGAEVEVRRVHRRGFVLNGRLLRRAEVEVGTREEA